MARRSERPTDPLLLAISLLSDDFQNKRRNHQCIRILLSRGQISAHFLGERFIDSAHLNQAQKIDVNELSRPLPHGVIWSNAKYLQRGRADDEAVLQKKRR